MRLFGLLVAPLLEPISCSPKPLLAEGHRPFFFTGPLLLYCLPPPGLAQKPALSWLVSPCKSWLPCVVGAPSYFLPWPPALLNSVESVSHQPVVASLSSWWPERAEASPLPGPHPAEGHRYLILGWCILVFMACHPTCLTLFHSHHNLVKHE